MKDSEFVFDSVHLFYYKCHQINPNLSGSYIDSQYFQYAPKVALNNDEIKKDPER